MSLKFQKKIEDFSCEYCGIYVTGSGFTNHCPKCLWSKHVDVYPGDREEVCKGLMEPIRVSLDRDGYFIHHRCIRCGLERRNKAAKGDNLDMLLGSNR